MKKPSKHKFKSKLLESKYDVMETIHSLDENMDYDNEFSTELSYYDNHPADMGTELFMKGQNINLKNNGENILYKIKNALEKIETNKYGVCESCSGKIDIDRLEILPYASKCMRCESENDHDTFVEQGTNKCYTFGRAFKDSFQSVNDYNIVPKDPSFSTGDYIGLANEDEIGIVEDVEKISEEYYREQL